MDDKNKIAGIIDDRFAAMGSNLPIIPTGKKEEDAANVVKSAPFPLSMWNYKEDKPLYDENGRPFFGLKFKTRTGREYLLWENDDNKTTSLYLEMNNTMGERQLTLLHTLEKNFWELSDREAVQAILIHDDLDLDEYCLFLEFYNSHNGRIEHLVTPFSIVAKGVTLSGLADMLGEDAHQTQIRISIPGKVFKSNDPLLEDVLAKHSGKKTSEEYAEVYSTRIVSVEEMTPNLIHIIKENDALNTHIRGVLGGNPRNIPRNVLCVFRADDGATLLRLSRNNMEQLLREVYEKEDGKLRQNERETVSSSLRMR